MLAALAIAGLWYAARYPSYLPPPGDQIDILLELAGVFPDKYQIMWREHGVLHSTDPAPQEDLALLRGAEFLHNLTTGGAVTDGDIYVEVAYRFYAHDHDIDAGTLTLDNLAADKGVMMCMCLGTRTSGTHCTGVLGFGNYEFSLTVNYNRDQCANAVDKERVAEFRRSLQTADKLINLYLEPLRRKPRWL